MRKAWRTYLVDTRERTEGAHRRLRRLLAQGPEVKAATRTVMLANRGKDSKPEMVVRRAFHAAGLRYRLHVRMLPGRPDIVLASRRTVVEVRGCFWHGHTCQGDRTPKTRSEFWASKIQINRERDARNAAALRRQGWNVLVIWECEVKRGAAPRLARRITAMPQVRARRRASERRKTPAPPGRSVVARRSLQGGNARVEHRPSVKDAARIANGRVVCS